MMSMKKILTFFFSIFALMASAQTVVITQAGTGSGIDTSYQLGDSIYIVAGGTDTIFTGVATSGGGGGSGTVTSVAATVPTGFSVTGSPITSSGTLAITNNLAAGVVKSSGLGLSFTSGLVNIITETTGTLTPARGGTGLTALGTANQLLRVNAGATALEYFSPTFPTGSGTTNYVPKWNGSNSLGVSGLYETATGNFGIGTTTPAFRLELNRAINGDFGIKVRNSADSTAARTMMVLEGSGSKSFYFEAVSPNYTAVPNWANSAVFTTDYPVLNFGTYTPAGEIRFHTAGISTSNDRMVITSGGNVGIAKAAPAEKLDITGNAQVSGVVKLAAATAAAPALTWSSDTNCGVYRPAADAIGFATDGSERVRITSTGVGIGMSAPVTALHVNGSIRAGIGNATTTAFYSLVNGLDLNTYYGGQEMSQFDSSAILKIGVSTNVATNPGHISIRPSGNVGIGTTAPSVKFEVEGTGTGNLNLALFDRASSPSTGNYTQFGIGLVNNYTTGIRSYNEGGSNFSTSIHTLISGLSNPVPVLYMTHLNKIGINQDTASYWLDVKGNKASTRLYSTSASAEIVLQNTTTGYLTDAGGTISQSGNDLEISTTASISIFSETTPSKVTSINSQGVFKSATFTGAEAVALTAADGMFIYVTSTSGVFTTVGFWGRENGTWVKL